MRKNKYIYIIGIIITLIVSFIPQIGIRVEDEDKFYGYPAQWLSIRIGGNLGFEPLGLLFNIIIFTLIALLIKKIFKTITNKKAE